MILIEPVSIKTLGLVALAAAAIIEVIIRINKRLKP